MFVHIQKEIAQKSCFAQILRINCAKLLYFEILLQLFLQVLVHSYDDHDDGVEYNVPFMADFRLPHVGQHCVALSRPAGFHAED